MLKLMDKILKRLRCNFMLIWWHVPASLSYCNTENYINLLMFDGISHSYELDQSISILRLFGGIFHLY